MKKVFLLGCACLTFLIIQANTANASESKYFFEHKPIAAGSNMKAAYGDGKQLVASYKPNSTVVVWLEDTGDSFLLSSKIGAKHVEFSLVAQRDIQLYAIDKKGKRKLVKQYKKGEVQKILEKELASDMVVPQTAAPEKQLVVNYQGAYGQNLGKATVREQNANPFDGVAGAILNPINAKRQARQAAAPYAQQYASAFWERQTFFPGDVLDGKALFADKKAPSYELVIQLGSDKHVFHFDRLKK